MRTHFVLFIVIISTVDTIRSEAVGSIKTKTAFAFALTLSGAASAWRNVQFQRGTVSLYLQRHLMKFALSSQWEWLIGLSSHQHHHLYRRRRCHYHRRLFTRENTPLSRQRRKKAREQNSEEKMHSSHLIPCNLPSSSKKTMFSASTPLFREYCVNLVCSSALCTGLRTADSEARN